MSCAKAKILIVDDIPGNLTTLRAILSDLDVDVIEATSGEEALKLVINNDFFAQSSHRDLYYLDFKVAGG